MARNRSAKPATAFAKASAVRDGGSNRTSKARELASGASNRTSKARELASGASNPPLAESCLKKDLLNKWSVVRVARNRSAKPATAVRIRH